MDDAANKKPLDNKKSQGWLKSLFNKKAGAVIALLAVAIAPFAAGCNWNSKNSNDNNNNVSNNIDNSTTVNNNGDLDHLGTNQDSTLVQGREGCIAELTRQGVADPEAVCNDMVAKAQEQTAAQGGNVQQYSDNAQTWFMLSPSRPPVMYYGNPYTGSLNMWYSGYAWNAFALGNYFATYGAMQLREFGFLERLSLNQVLYMRTALPLRPGIARPPMMPPRMPGPGTLPRGPFGGRPPLGGPGGRGGRLPFPRPPVGRPPIMPRAPMPRSPMQRPPMQRPPMQRPPMQRPPMQRPPMQRPPMQRPPMQRPPVQRPMPRAPAPRMPMPRFPGRGGFGRR
jgi:hypothetical protein